MLFPWILLHSQSFFSTDSSGGLPPLSHVLQTIVEGVTGALQCGQFASFVEHLSLKCMCWCLGVERSIEDPGPHLGTFLPQRCAAETYASRFSSF